MNTTLWSTFRVLLQQQKRVRLDALHNVAFPLIRQWPERFISVTMETRCFHKKVRISTIPAKRFLYRSLSANLRKKSFKLFKNLGKNIPRPILGQDRPEKNSAKCLFEAARFRVLDRHRSIKPTTASRNLNGARPLGAPTCLLYTSPSPRDRQKSRMPSSA